MTPKFSLADLEAVQQICTGAQDPTLIEAAEKTRQWVEDQGIDPNDWAKFAHSAGRAGVLMAQIARLMGANDEAAFAAIFSAGFEFGVRFQEWKQVVV